MTHDHAPPRLRSRRWFRNSADQTMTTLYVDRYVNYGITREELQGDNPVIGIAQTADRSSLRLQAPVRVRVLVPGAGAATTTATTVRLAVLDLMCRRERRHQRRMRRR